MRHLGVGVGISDHVRVVKPHMERKGSKGLAMKRILVYLKRDALGVCMDMGLAPGRKPLFLV